MTDLASIGLQVDSSQVKTGATALDGLTTAAKGTTSAAAQLTAAMAATSAETSQYQLKVMAALQAQYGMTAAQAASVAGIKLQTDAMEENGLVQIQLGNQLKLNMALTAQRAREAAAADALMIASTRARAAAETAAAAEAARIANQRTNAENALANNILAFNMRMTKQRAALAAEEARAIELAAAKEAAAVVASDEIQGASHKKLGLTTLQIREPLVLVREAVRGDFTRMAGSASLLAGTFSAATLGMIASIGAVLAPIGAMTVAFIQGSAEADKLNKAIASTGNFAGTTANQVDSLVKSLSGKFNQGAGSIRTALTDVIASGKFTHDTINLMIEDAIKFSQISGQSVDKVMQSYEQAKGGVVKYAVTQEEAYHNITLAQIDYINQLEKEGNHQAAEKQYFQDIHDNMPKTVEAYGWLQTAIHTTTTLASNMWDALLGVGRGKTIDQQITEQASEVQFIAKGLSKQATTGSDAQTINARHAQLDDAVARLHELQINKNFDDQQAAAISAKAQKEDDAIRAMYDNQQHKFPKGHQGADYTTAAIEIQNYNLKLQDENELYGVFDEIQIKTITQSNQEILAIEKKKDAKGHYIDLTDKEIDQITDLTRAQVQNQITNNAAIKIWEGMNKAANDYSDTIAGIALVASKGGFAPGQEQAATRVAGINLAKANDPLYTQNQNYQEQIKLLGVLGDEKAIQLKLDQERFALEADPQNFSTTKINQMIAAYRTLLDAEHNIIIADQNNAAGIAIANKVRGDIQFNSDRVARYRSASAQINQIAHAEGWSYAQTQRAQTLLQVSELKERVANVDGALSEIATLTSSSNKTLRAIGKTAAIAQATIDGALAILATMKGTPFPWNIPLVAAESVAVAVQIAKIEAMAGGGMVRGSGGPRQDNIPIMASAGEFMVNADATSKNRALLERINSGQASNDNYHFANGGMVSGNGQSGQINNHFDFSNTNFGKATKEEIVQYLDTAMRTVYGPAIITQSVRTSLQANRQAGTRQKLNPRNGTLG